MIHQILEEVFEISSIMKTMIYNLKVLVTLLVLTVLVIVIDIGLRHSLIQTMLPIQVLLEVAPVSSGVGAPRENIEKVNQG